MAIYPAGVYPDDSDKHRIDVYPYLRFFGNIPLNCRKPIDLGIIDGRRAHKALLLRDG
jgi:hypothetical protein